MNTPRVDIKNIRYMCKYAEKFPRYAEVCDKITEVSQVLTNYAKANKVRIKFEYDYSVSPNEAHRLNVIVSDNSMFSDKFSQNTFILPDTNAITVFKPNKNHSYEDNFTRGLYRIISELTENIRNNRENEQLEIVQAAIKEKYKQHMLCL